MVALHGESLLEIQPRLLDADLQEMTSGKVGQVIRKRVVELVARIRLLLVPGRSKVLRTNGEIHESDGVGGRPRL